jgi:hypothetical protein
MARAVPGRPGRTVGKVGGAGDAEHEADVFAADVIAEGGGAELGLVLFLVFSAGGGAGGGPGGLVAGEADLLRREGAEQGGESDSGEEEIDILHGGSLLFG